VLISIAGGGAGPVFAAFSVPVLMSLVGATLPRADTVAVDYRVVLFTFGLALLTGSSSDWSRRYSRRASTCARR
jgi:hypothetical protein